MRKPPLMAGLILLFSFLAPCAKAQTLNWGSSFSPSWLTSALSGIANNIAGTGINSNASVSLSGGSFTYANAFSGSMSPTVSGATATVPGSAQRMQVGVNFSTNTNNCIIVLNFTSLITNASFRIVDIDKLSSTSFNYVDMITVTGSNGSSTFLPTITKYDAVTDPNFLVISGNTAYANPVSGLSDNTASDAGDQRGTINVNFGSASINSITIRYENHSSAQANPGGQFIAIGNVGFSQSVLPVSLLSFAGAQQGDDVKLKWSTAQEWNSDAYIIERSIGSSNWSAIGTVAARGIATDRSDYTYTDISPEKKEIYYRLKMTDRDGAWKYSSVIRISNKAGVEIVSAYPSLFSSQFGISVYSPERKLVTTTLVDASGRQVAARSQQLEKGNNSYTMQSLGHLPSGVYYINIADDENKLLARSSVVKQ